MLQKFNTGTTKSKYLCNFITEEKTCIYIRKLRLWLFQDKLNPTKVFRSRSSSWEMIASFFHCTVNKATIPSEDGMVCTNFFSVISEIIKNNWKRRIIPHRDNAVLCKTTSNNWLFEGFWQLFWFFPPTDKTKRTLRKVWFYLFQNQFWFENRLKNWWSYRLFSAQSYLKNFRL